MPYAKLQAVLGDDGMSELEALLAQANAAPMVAWKAWAVGTLKSWTTWFGAGLLLLPDFLQQVAPQFEQALDANAYKRLMNVIGVIVIVLRFKTTQSLKDKGETK